MIKVQHRVYMNQLLEHFQLPKVVVEVGTAEGRFSQNVYEWNLDKLYLVDVFENVPFLGGCAGFEQEWHNKNYEEVKERFDGKDNVIILKGFSHKMCDEVPDESVGIVYLDADHTYNSVMTDLKCWLPKLVKGGIMAGHDYLNGSYGVSQAVNEFAKDKYEVNIIEEDGQFENASFWFQKKYNDTTPISDTIQG